MVKKCANNEQDKAVIQDRDKVNQRKAADGQCRKIL